MFLLQQTCNLYTHVNYINSLIWDVSWSITQVWLQLMKCFYYMSTNCSILNLSWSYGTSWIVMFAYLCMACSKEVELPFTRSPKRVSSFVSWLKRCSLAAWSSEWWANGSTPKVGETVSVPPRFLWAATASMAVGTWLGSTLRPWKSTLRNCTGVPTPTLERKTHH